MGLAPKNPGGRPPTYQSVEQMQDIIAAYLKMCEGTVAVDAEGEAILNKYGQPVIVGARPPTVTGLALALGFTSRQALLNYQAKPKFVDTITRAKSQIEEYAEMRLYDRDGVNGAKFSLINNFKGWSERPDETQQDGGVQIIDDL